MGHFYNDAETGLFPAFIVVWGGRGLNLTSAVNNPLVFGGCDLSPSGGSGYDTFAALVFGPTLRCPGDMVWTANEISPGVGNFGFAKNNISIGPGVGPIESGPFPLSSGGISASPRVPEPSTVVLMITGGALLAWRRRVVHRSTRSQQ